MQRISKQNSRTLALKYISYIALLSNLKFLITMYYDISSLIKEHNCSLVICVLCNQTCDSLGVTMA